jgi:translation initiation factor IF-2
VAPGGAFLRRRGRGYIRTGSWPPPGSCRSCRPAAPYLQSAPGGHAVPCGRPAWRCPEGGCWRGGGWGPRRPARPLLGRAYCAGPRRPSAVRGAGWRGGAAGVGAGGGRGARAGRPPAPPLDPRGAPAPTVMCRGGRRAGRGGRHFGSYGCWQLRPGGHVAGEKQPAAESAGETLVGRGVGRPGGGPGRGPRGEGCPEAGGGCRVTQGQRAFPASFVRSWSAVDIPELCLFIGRLQRRAEPASHSVPVEPGGGRRGEVS